MTFALIAFVLFLNGASDQLGKSFSSAEACLADQPKVAAQITKYNEANPNKIVAFAAVCVPLAKAPQGQDV